MATAGQLLDQFRSWLGAVERPDGSNHVLGITTRFWDDAWCAMTCSVCCDAVAIPLWTAAVAGIMERAQNGRDGWSWGHTPRVGAMICFDWGDGGIRTDHVGVVEAIRPDGMLVTIEGNHRNRCERVVRHPSDDVLGYAYPPLDVPAPQPPLEDAMFSPAGEYPCVTLTNLRNRKALDIAGPWRPGAPVGTAVADGLLDQRWGQIFQRPLEEVSFVSRAGLALDCASDGTNRVHAVPYDDGNPNQRWLVRWQPDGSWLLEHAHREGLVLTAEDTDDGGGLLMLPAKLGPTGYDRTQLWVATDVR